jgi:hypothetical protein
MKTKRKFVKTPDYFFPNFKDDMVEISFVKHGKCKYAVVVFGNDDYGLEKEVSDINEGLKLFYKIKDGVTIVGLKGLGFNTF